MPSYNKYVVIIEVMLYFQNEQIVIVITWLFGYYLQLKSIIQIRITQILHLFKFDLGYQIHQISNLCENYLQIVIILMISLIYVAILMLESVIIKYF